MENRAPTDFDILENIKENIRPSDEGRSASALASIFSNPVGELKEAQLEQQAEYEMLINECDDLDDPLEAFVEYIKWIELNFPGGATVANRLVNVLERCTRQFQDWSIYRNDPRYLKIWLRYATYSDQPVDVFVFMYRKEIGVQLALYYEEYAKLLELHRRFEQANQVYQRGLLVEARPLRRLQTRYNEFRQRMAVNMVVEDVEAGDPFPQRTALGVKGGYLATEGASVQVDRSEVRHGIPERSRSEIIGNKSKKISVYTDMDEESRVMFKTGGWNEFGTVASRTKENRIDAKPWVGQVLKQRHQEGKKTVEKVVVYRDDDLRQDAHVPVYKVVEQTGKNPEKLDVNLDFLHTSNGEFCLNEVLALMRGNYGTRYDILKDSSEDLLLGKLENNDFARDFAEEIDLDKLCEESPKKSDKVKVDCSIDKSPTVTMTAFTKEANKEVYSMFNQSVGKITLGEFGQEESVEEMTENKQTIVKVKPIGEEYGIDKLGEDVAELSVIEADEEPSLVNNVFLSTPVKRPNSRKASPFVKKKFKGGLFAKRDNLLISKQVESSMFFDKNVDLFSNLAGSKELVNGNFDTKADNSNNINLSHNKEIINGKFIHSINNSANKISIDNSSINDNSIHNKQKLNGKYDNKTENSTNDNSSHNKELTNGKFDNLLNNSIYNKEMINGKFDNLIPNKTENSTNYKEMINGKFDNSFPNNKTENSTHNKETVNGKFDNKNESSTIDQTKNTSNIKKPVLLSKNYTQTDPIFDKTFDLSSHNKHQIEAIKPFNTKDSLPQSIATCKTFDPFDRNLRLKLIPKEKLNHYQSPTAKRFLQDKRQPKTVTLGQKTYTIKKQIGAGGYGKVYLCECDGELYAVKVESPSNVWEYFIINSIHARLGVSSSSYIVQAVGFYEYLDESFMVLNYKNQGNVLDLVNKFGCLDELLAMFLTIKLIKTVEHLHDINIIHGDIKADNCMIKLSNVSINGKITAKKQAQALFETQGVSLIDFGRSIDLSLFPDDCQFKSKLQHTDLHDCPEIQHNKPWTFEIDYHGLANVIHTMLFGKYIVTKLSNDKHSLEYKLKRYWQQSLWSPLFDFLLNPKNTQQSLPNTSRLRFHREKLEHYLYSDPLNGFKNVHLLQKQILNILND